MPVVADAILLPDGAVHTVRESPVFRVNRDCACPIGLIDYEAEIVQQHSAFSWLASDEPQAADRHRKDQRIEILYCFCVEFQTVTLPLISRQFHRNGLEFRLVGAVHQFKEHRALVSLRIRIEFDRFRHSGIFVNRVLFKEDAAARADEVVVDHPAATVVA